MNEWSNSTSESFFAKWNGNPDLAFKETLNPNSEIHRWILERNGFSTDQELRFYLSRFNRMLDAGCGNGRVTALLASMVEPSVEIVGVDLVSAEIAHKNLEEFGNVEIIAADLLGNLEKLGTFDFIYCQEVLHHTDDPFLAFTNMVSSLEPGGVIAIYVYREKAPIREFCDDHIRSIVTQKTPEEAMEICKDIAALGRDLSHLEGNISVSAIPILGIEAGEYSVQRLIYHFFFKCFWNDSLSFQDNVAINYDWYHPVVASRHTLDEVRTWFNKLNLEVIHENVDHYGITLHGTLVK